ncbi:class I SAM-dependent methyltransferase [Verrucomicrobiota bacterium]
MPGTAASLRRISKSAYPELTGYSDEDVWRDNMGPGALYLAARLSRHLGVKPGDLVLDLGCGKAESSIFLARHLGVRVVAVDSSTDAAFLADKFRRREYGSQILPLQLDARQHLPFAEDYFDGLFCMNSLSFFAGDVACLRRLIGHVRPGGSFVAGGECMSAEFTEEQRRSPPDVYNFADGIWEGDFLKLHSPAWWLELLIASKVLDVHECAELDDGVIMHEEKLAAATPHGYLGMSPEETRDLEMRQVLYGRNHEPYMTVFLAAGSKRG